MKISLVSLAIIWLAVTGCGGQTAVPSSAQVSPAQEVPVTWEESESVKALEALSPLIPGPIQDWDILI